MCSIAYEPCNEQSFRIGPAINPNLNPLGGFGNTNFISPSGFNGINPANSLADVNNLNALNMANFLANQNAAALMNSKNI